MHVNLPEATENWVKAQAAREGYASPDAYISELIEHFRLTEKETFLPPALEDSVAEALQGPFHAMTEDFWNRLRQRISPGA